MTRLLACSGYCVDPAGSFPIWAVVALGAFVALIFICAGVDEAVRKHRERHPQRRPDGPRFPHLKN